MLKIKINGYVIQIDLYDMTLKNWLKISDIIIEQYGYDYFYKLTYEVIKGDPFYEDEYTNK